MKFNEFIWVIVIVILSVIFCSSFLFPLNKILFEDSYLQFCAYIDANLIHFNKDHKIPFWVYHFGGGYPIIKHPDNISLCPLFYLFVVPFGTAIGIKLIIFFSYIIGIAGFFLLARNVLKCNLFSSAITTMFFIFNSFIPYLVNTGSATKEPVWFYLPFIVYTLILSKKNRNYIFLCAGLMTLLLLNGFGLNMVTLVLFIFMLVLFDGLSRPGNRILNQKRLFINFIFVLVIAFFLGAFKTFPLWELLKINIRAIDSYSEVVFCPSALPMTFTRMLLALFSRGPYADGNEAVMGEDGLGMTAVGYFGVIPGLLFFLAVIFCFKKVWKYLLLIVIFICFCMANNCPIDLFYILWHFPLFHSLHCIVRYFFFMVIFLIPVVIGVFFSSEIFSKFNKWLKFTIYFLAIIAAADMFISNSKYYKFAAAYSISSPNLRTENEFFNVEIVELDSVPELSFCSFGKKWTEKQETDLEWGIHYYLLRQNIGLTNWPDELSLENSVSPKYKIIFGYGDYWKDFRSDLSEKNGIIKNEDYKGESFFLNPKENKVKGIKWETNRIVINVNQNKPDQLIINQNYDPAWKSNYGEVFNRNGCIGVKLNDSMKGDIILSYELKSFYFGLIVSIGCFLVCMWYIFYNKRKSV